VRDFDNKSRTTARVSPEKRQEILDSRKSFFAL